MVESEEEELNISRTATPKAVFVSLGAVSILVEV